MSSEELVPEHKWSDFPVLLSSTLGVECCDILDARQKHHWATALLCQNRDTRTPIKDRWELVSSQEQPAEMSKHHLLTSSGGHITPSFARLNRRPTTALGFMFEVQGAKAISL